MTAGPTVALDVGGTLMKGAVVDRDGTARAVEQRPTLRQPDTVEGILSTLPWDRSLVDARRLAEAITTPARRISHDFAYFPLDPAQLGIRILPPWTDPTPARPGRREAASRCARPCARPSRA